MGLFSSKSKTTVGTTVSRVIADDALPQSVKTGVINAIFDKGRVDEHILENLAAGVGVRAGRMYEYGKTGYSFGLPSGQVVSSADGTGAVTSLLKALYGPSTTLEYSHFGPLNNLHLGWVKLSTEHGYDPVTNVLGALSAAKGLQVYLKDLVVVVTEASMVERTNGSLDQWGTPANAGPTPIQPAGLGTFNTVTPFEVDALAAEDSVRVSYVWNQPTPVVVGGVTVIRQVLQEGSFSIPMTGYDPFADYFQVKYVHAAGIGYWLYKAGTGTHPEVDNSFLTTHTGLGSFFPFAYFRYAKASMAANPASPEYRSSKKLVKYLGMDYDSVVEAIHENPDIEQVEQAMLMLAVPANTSNPLEQRYLFDFFRRLHYDSGAMSTGGSSLDAFNIAAALGNPAASISRVIEDARFKMSIGCQAIFKRRKVGSIGAINSYASGYDNLSTTETGTDAETGLPYSWTTSTPFHYYRRQLSATLYEEVQVYGMRMTYHIYGGHTTVGDEQDAILLVPLDYSITDRYSIPDKETLYARSLHYIFNSRVVTKVKWYQQGWFTIVIQIIGIVVSFYSPGTGFAILAATMTATQIIVMIAMKLLTYLVVSAAIKLFIKIVGVKMAFLVAIVAAMRGIYISFQAGSIAGAPWAKELLQLASNLSSAVGDSYTEAIKGLQKEAEAFGQYIEDKTKELTDANTLLNASSVLSPFVVFGESPDEFFNRTVHSGNIGIRGIEAVSNYVEMSLTLPKLTDSLQGDKYGY